jgi:hypothetical protein
MSGNPSAAGKNAMLDGLGNVALYASLHTGNPGATGTNEATGGSPAYARKPITWAAAASGSKTTSANITFDIPAGTYSWVGLWSASTAGTYYYKIQLPAAQVYAAQATFTISAITIDQSLVTNA